MRSYVLSRLNDIDKLVVDPEKEIPIKYWVKTNAETQADFIKLSRDVRLALKEDGLAHPKALKLLWKIRYAEDPSNAECVTSE